MFSEPPRAPPEDYEAGTSRAADRAVALRLVPRA